MFSTAMKSLWDKPYGKFLYGCAVGAFVVALVYPSKTKTTDIREQVEKEVSEQYEKKLLDKSTEIAELNEKHTKEMSSLKEESSRKEEEFKSKIDTLNSEVTSLRTNTFTETVKITHPDGTVEYRKTTHSTMETINEKVAQVKQEVEKKMSETVAKLEQQHQSELFELNSVHKIEIAKLEQEVLSRKEQEKRLVEKHEVEMRNNRKFGVGGGYGTDKLYDFQAHYYMTQSVFVGTEVGTNLQDSTRASFIIGVGF